jgi:nitric oxide dioxygenase
MISAAARPYIDASVPVLREHGQAITSAFYRKLFAELPQLSNLFNMTNQANGAQQQSLAAAVFAYAANIGNPTALGPVVQRIVHKHVSVGVREEHYPIVGRHLLGAISEVLGAAATPALLGAWAEAYQSLAKLFIATERELYAAARVVPGELRTMRVVGTSRAGAGVLALRLEPKEGSVPTFCAGQYVSVAVTLPGGQRQLRQYSLSDAPDGKTLRISVKRDGAVSNWLHQHAQLGSELQVSHPFGEFTPDTESNAPLVLLSAGVGITPMIGTLLRIAQVNPQRHVIFAHAARDLDHHAHRIDLDDVKARMPNLHVVLFYEDVAGADAALAGRMDVARLPHWPRAETPVYLCGPTPFMQAQWQDLLQAGVPPALLRREVFGPELLEHLL